MHRHLRSTGLSELASDTLSETLPDSVDKHITGFVCEAFDIAVVEVCERQLDFELVVGIKSECVDGFGCNVGFAGGAELHCGSA